MPDSDAVIKLLDDTLDTLHMLRETGVKRVELSPELIAVLRQRPVARPAAAPKVTSTPSTKLASGVPSAAITTCKHLIEQCRACSMEETPRTLPEPRPCDIAVITGAFLAGDEQLALDSRLEGRAGELFDKMFAAVGLSRKDLYITPAVKCFCKPSTQMLLSCNEHLKRELAIVQPKVVVLLGTLAVKALYPRDAMTNGRIGQWNRVDGLRTIALHHPARLLMLSEAVIKPMKRENWEALKSIRTLLGK